MKASLIAGGQESRPKPLTSHQRLAVSSQQEQEVDC